MAIRRILAIQISKIYQQSGFVPFIYRLSWWLKPDTESFVAVENTKHFPKDLLTKCFKINFSSSYGSQRSYRNRKFSLCSPFFLCFSSNFRIYLSSFKCIHIINNSTNQCIHLANSLIRLLFVLSLMLVTYLIEIL